MSAEGLRLGWETTVRQAGAVSEKFRQTRQNAERKGTQVAKKNKLDG